MEPVQRCGECGAPVAGDQRYCLQCGARLGDASPGLVSLLQRVREREDEPSAPETSPVEASRGSLRLPSARISAVLVAMFLGFGMLLGNAAQPRVATTLAASRRLKLVVPATPASAPAGTSGTASSTAETASQPESEPEPTPAPAAETASTSAKSEPAQSGSTSKSETGSSKSEGSGEAAAPKPASKLPAVKHVFVLMLSDQAYASVFGPASPAHYLAGTLEHRGELLVQYDAVAHEELANEVALLSGQGPTAETEANCPTYTEITPASSGVDEQVLGNGCIYPAATQTLPGQLAAKHLTWRAYVEGIDEPGDSEGACAHPALSQADPTSAQTSSTGPYATFRNPFVYFDSVLASPSCAADDVGLSRLSSDLASAKSAPSFAYIVPDRCHDGNPTPCTAGAPAGLAPADGFIEKVVPEITGSKAYKEGGLLVITVDEAPSSGEFADSSSCCGQPSFPNVPAATTSLRPRGGGAVGALLLSPFVKGGTTSQEPYNHFSLLRTIEDFFGLKHLGYAALPGVKSFEPALFTTTGG